MDLNNCDIIFDSTLKSQSEAEFCHRISPLFDQYEVISIGLGRGNIFWRARAVEETTWPNLSDLDYPPAEKARRGRLNDAGSPCFYVAKDIETALLEIQAKEGQLVQVAGFRILNEDILRMIVVGEYANVQKSGYMHFTGTDPGRTLQKQINLQDKKKALTLLYIDKFLASILADPHARQSNYTFSRALGALLHSKVDADGIVFPSVRDPGGFNLAVQRGPSDRALHNVACVLIKVGRKRRFSVLDYEIASSALKIDDELNFVWPDEHQPRQLNVYGLNKQEFDFAHSKEDDANRIADVLSMYSSDSK